MHSYLAYHDTMTDDSTQQKQLEWQTSATNYLVTGDKRKQV